MTHNYGTDYRIYTEQLLLTQGIRMAIHLLTLSRFNYLSVYLVQMELSLKFIGTVSVTIQVVLDQDGEEHRLDPGLLFK